MQQLLLAGLLYTAGFTWLWFEHLATFGGVKRRFTEKWWMERQLLMSSTPACPAIKSMTDWILAGKLSRRHSNHWIQCAVLIVLENLAQFRMVKFSCAILLAWFSNITSRTLLSWLSPLDKSLMSFPLLKSWVTPALAPLLSFFLGASLSPLDGCAQDCPLSIHYYS